MKTRLLQAYVTNQFWLSCLGPLVFLLPKTSIIWLS